MNKTPQMTKDIQQASGKGLDTKPLQKIELGEGLELWKVHVAILKEQTLNARSMTSDMFLQLSDNIKRGKRLESLPLCALTEQGLEIVSGHHRVRAARKADITEIWVLVDVTNLSRDAIRAKQLAHNSIAGEDNPDLLKQIFSQIDDVEARIEAYISIPDLDSLTSTSVTLTSKDLEVGFNMKVVSLNFLPLQFKEFERAITLLEGTNPDAVYIAQRDEYDELVAAMNAVSKQYDIRNTPTIFAKMAEIVIAQVEHEKGKKDANGEQAAA